MAKKKEKNDPSVTSSAYCLMAGKWDKVQTVLDGTDAMRSAGEKYCPRHEHEEMSAYQERIDTSTLFNASEQILNSWVGRPFSDPVEIGDDVPDAVRELLDDIDMQGNHVSVFARNWFKEGLAKAFAHVLVDHPAPSEVENRSLFDDRQENLRPYFSFIKPENLIFASAVFINGREVLTHVRITEEEVLRVGFQEEVTQRIRVFDRIFPGEETGGIQPGVYFTLWEKVGKDEWDVVDGPNLMTIDEIPLVTFYADREGFMLGKSPIEDLVDLNIRHWQSTSNQNVAVDIARFPLLAVAGAKGGKGGKTVIGPKRTLSTPDASGRWYYVEHSGAAIKVGQEDLQKLEEKMATYAADFLVKRSGDLTATARALDAAEATSPLQDAVVRFNDALAQAVWLLGKWLRIEEVGHVSVSQDFGPEEVVAGDLDALKFARQTRDISRDTYLSELKRRGALSDGFDSEKNAEELQQEEMAFGGEAEEEINADG